MHTLAYFSITCTGYDDYPFYDYRLYNLRKISFITQINLQVVICYNLVKWNIYFTLLLTVSNYLNGQFVYMHSVETPAAALLHAF